MTQPRKLKGKSLPPRRVSQRQQLEEKLVESETQFRELFDHAPVGIFHTLPAGKYLRVNPAAAHLFGFASPEELIATITDPAHQLYLDPLKHAQVLAEVMEQRDWVRTINQYRHRNGSIVLAHLTMRKVLDANGNLAYLEGFIENVTERQKAEDALLQAVHFARTTIDALPEHVCVLDETGTIIAVNRMWRDFAYANSDRESQVSEGVDYLTICDSTIGEDADVAHQVAAAIRGIIGGATEAFSIEYPCHAPFEKRWFVAHVNNFPGGGKARVVIAHENITQRKLAEERVHESERKYRMLFEESPISLWEEDFSAAKRYMDGIRASGFVDLRKYFLDHPQDLIDCFSLVRVLDVNRATLRIFHAQDKSELLNDVRRVVPILESPAQLESLLAVADGKTRFDSEVVNETLDHQPLHAILTWNIAPGFEDTYGKVIVSLIDITGRKNADATRSRLIAQLQSSREQLQTLSRRMVQLQEEERREIARELHDEIGQWLTGLKLLLHMSKDMPMEKIQANIEQAQKTIAELVARVRDISLDLRPAMLDDLGLVPTLVWYVERYTTQTRIQVTLKHTGVDGRRFGSAIETAAYRIVQEALTNVARHSACDQVSVRVGATDEMLTLQIQDQGKGFDATRAIATGEAAGLTGMRERAILLGGNLTIESAPSSGTCITAEIPLMGWMERRAHDRFDSIGR